jgi:hypothetical protein
MIKQKQVKANTLTTIVRQVKTTVSIPFTEKPVTDPSSANRSNLEAYDLFSLFTANIIKEEVVFTR